MLSRLTYTAVQTTTNVACTSRLLVRLSRDVRQLRDISKPTLSTSSASLNDVTRAYRGVPTRRLIRAMFVFKLCSVEWLVSRQTTLLVLLRRLMGRHLYASIMRATVFGQFIAGDRDDVIMDTARWVASRDVTPMFAYTAAEMPASAEDGTSTNTAAMQAYRQANYAGVRQCIDLAARVKELGNYPRRATSKVCFFVDINTLKRVSQQITNQNAYLATTDVQKLRQHVQSLSASPAAQQLLQKLNKDGQSAIPNLMTSLSLHLDLATLAMTSSPSANQLPRPSVTDSDVTHMRHSYKTMDELCGYALERHVQIVWDAEQTYLNPAIQAAILDLMRTYNKSRVHVFNTYQCYLKSTLATIKRDMHVLNNENLLLGAKIVRGAYMDEERRLAKEENKEDPVNPSFDATTRMYESVIDSVLEQMTSHKAEGRQLADVIVATHNSDTVDYVINRLKELGLTGNKNICFAQLLGMRDYLAYNTAARGYSACKLLHFGGVDDVTAYLSRRLTENRSALPSADLERHLLWRELKSRVTWSSSSK